MRLAASSRVSLTNSGFGIRRAAVGITILNDSVGLCMGLRKILFRNTLQRRERTNLEMPRMCRSDSMEGDLLDP